MTSDDTAHPEPLSGGSISLYHPLRPLGTEVGRLLSPHGCFPPTLFCSLWKTRRQTLASATWVLLLAVTHCTVPSVPLVLLRTWFLSHSATLLQLQFLVILIPVQMMLPGSWPCSMLAKLKDSLVFSIVLATTLVITLNLPLPITQDSSVISNTPLSNTNPLSSSRTLSPRSP